jgi:hypothetical protein
LSVNLDSHDLERKVFPTPSTQRKQVQHSQNIIAFFSTIQKI